MEKKQGFFSALREEVARGLSPGRVRSESPGRAPSQVARCSAARVKEQYYGRGGAAEWRAAEERGGKRWRRSWRGRIRGGGGGGVRKEGWRVGEGHSRARPPSPRRRGGAAAEAARPPRATLRPRLLLGVMGRRSPHPRLRRRALPHLSIKDTPIETSSAQYILQQYTAACGGVKLLSSIRNSYAMGKVKCGNEFESANKIIRIAIKGRRNRAALRVAEMAAGGQVLPLQSASSSGPHPCWAHAAKGRRLSVDSPGPGSTDNCKHVCQCSMHRGEEGERRGLLHPEAFCGSQTLQLGVRACGGLLVHIEDSHLTRIQSNTCGDAVYWETTISSFIEDYRPIDGMMIAHSGRSQVTLSGSGKCHEPHEDQDGGGVDHRGSSVQCCGLSVDCFILRLI
ncbi:hypothetical protein ACMD2_05561 [Ananas comosus]|uniref:Uncharacterized protein n=1 Tax=Ananas comosus TaxID=4615 RepID=A0A199VW48_ANACO|nr:hypothetical protein ACMD2_05561 [Ananas comosus]